MTRHGADLSVPPNEPVAALREVVTNPYRLRYVAGKVILYAILIFGAILVTIPFIWLVFQFAQASSSTGRISTDLDTEADPVGKLPEGTYCLTFWSLILNTVIIATGSTLGSLVSSSLGAFAFSRLRWRSGMLSFLPLLLTIMLPGQITMIPRFVLFSKLGWVNTYLPLIVPAWFASPFYVFLMRQFFMGLPSELDDAARIDGPRVSSAYTGASCCL